MIEEQESTEESTDQEIGVVKRPAISHASAIKAIIEKTKQAQIDNPELWDPNYVE